MIDRNYFGCMMVETGEADAMISGLTKNYPDTIRPAIEIIGTEEGVKKIAGMYLMLTKKGPLFLADTLSISIRQPKNWLISLCWLQKKSDISTSFRA